MHVKARPAANLCHVGTPMIAVAAEATPRRSTRAPHARVPTLTSTADDQPDQPYGLEVGRNVVRAAERDAVAVRIAALCQRAHVVSLHAVVRRRTARNRAAPTRLGEYPRFA